MALCSNLSKFSSTAGHLIFSVTLCIATSNLSSAQSSLDYELHKAVKNKDYQLTQSLIDRGANPNTVTSQGNVALSIAVDRKDPQLVTLLIENGADPNFCTGRNSHLEQAILRADAATAEALLKGGASTNARTPWAGHVFRQATKRQKGSELVDVLLRYGADRETEELWQTAAEQFSHGQKGALRLFQSKNTSDLDKRDVFHLYAVRGESRAVELQAFLEDSNALHSVTCTGATALHLAASHARLATMKVLIDAGLSPNDQDNTGRTPLHYAAKAGHGGSLLLLLDKGASKGILDVAGTSVLSLAKRYRERNQDELLPELDLAIERLSTRD